MSFNHTCRMLLIILACTPEDMVGTCTVVVWFHNTQYMYVTVFIYVQDE